MLSLKVVQAHMLAVASGVGKYVALDLNPLIDGMAEGAEYLFDFIVELLPIIIILGIFGIILVFFYFKRK